MSVPKHLFYTNDHEWASNSGGEITVGITDFAQGELGDIIFVELPAVGQEFSQGDPFGTIEAVKTVADLYAPVSGKIIDVNQDLDDEPAKINSDPYGAGWIIKIEASDISEIDELLSADDYKKLLD
ncbi:MAG: glycine cleavage system protein GcvH [Candidatus Neomarinimicrobiota bacterium]